MELAGDAVRLTGEGTRPLCISENFAHLFGWAAKPYAALGNHQRALDQDRVTLSVTSPENGTAAEEVPGDYAAAPMEIGFNARYLKDIIDQVDGDTVEMHLADAAAPTLIRENDDSRALSVLMPMRV